jgi:hypothetical protein
MKAAWRTRGASMPDRSFGFGWLTARPDLA